MLNKTKKLKPVHPGEVLREEFLRPMNRSSRELAESLHVPIVVIDALLDCRETATAELALRLSRYFGNSPQFWRDL
ncbi:MAG: HigA family addiction module antidote protein [Planctomycetaceae bacterium]|jgi:addiction module HigA family antidote|nr:HigA family addiction module antidote protein [Planctomycetaceae bacterium]